MGTIDGRIYPHGLDSYDTSFDLRRHLMIRINAYSAYTLGWTSIENTMCPPTAPGDSYNFLSAYCIGHTMT
jgi:hypothetical protein